MANVKRTELDHILATGEDLAAMVSRLKTQTQALPPDRAAVYLADLTLAHAAIVNLNGRIERDLTAQRRAARA